MHPKNIYKRPPDFRELAIEFEGFRKYVKTDISGKVTIDYQDQNAVKELTKTLLKKDFNLEVDISETRLIPRVPLSLNYILWIEDLLNLIQLKSKPLGIDIGTGCVCIYSLLAAKKGWKMLATELDPENFKCAEKNVKQNSLNEDISVKLVSNSNDLLIGVINENVKYDFCMCNPPFYNYNEKPQNRTSRRKLLDTVASKVTAEMTTEGGELEFIKKLIRESEKLKDQIKIYTTLVGKKTDFIYLKKEVQKVVPKSVSFTEFCQGRTTRWGLAWTFLDIELKVKEKFDSKKLKKNKIKPPLQYILPTNKVKSLDLAIGDVKKVMDELKISFKEESVDVGHMLHFKAYENTWSHQRRKKRLEARAKKVMDDLKEGTLDPEHWANLKLDENTLSQQRRQERLEARAKKVMDELGIGIEETVLLEYWADLKTVENTWSHPRRKKRLQATAGDSEALHPSSVRDDEGSSEAKRLKLNEEITSNIKPVIIEGLIMVKNVDSSIIFEMSWVSGDKQALHQIFQYFKNYWSQDA